MNSSRRNFILGSSALATMAITQKAIASSDPLIESAKKKLRLLVLNPNTSNKFTQLIVSETIKAAGDNVEVVGLTSDFGPDYIGSEVAIGIAMHSLIDMMAKQIKNDAQFDAAIIAGFGCGEAAILQEMVPFPVIGLLEASLSTALLFGRKFSILSGGEKWKPILEKQVENFGLASRLASVRTVSMTGAEIVENPDKAYDMIVELSETCAQKDGASCVILGGAALAGFPAIIHDRVSVPLIDNLAVTISTALTLAKYVPQPNRSHQTPSPSMGSKNLSPELADFLANKP
ncbi:aspartate/glutamate racemase family protein [Proteus myxofaciens]|uniref:Hydantoin racemase n=1 Tax=Proteus myxofaciens ATCC 19692 TaxID=1354337 RepID=A0A198GEW5_9GAMM|nr:aspartate/glutamate racemase family protein [Proteus myxofaciens]OAT35987.1 hydantoin racemase [Proteus myxofaciens ATCC 19692]